MGSFLSWLAHDCAKLSSTMQRDGQRLNYHCSLDPIARVHRITQSDKPPNAVAFGGLLLMLKSGLSVVMPRHRHTRKSAAPEMVNRNRARADFRVWRCRR